MDYKKFYDRLSGSLRRRPQLVALIRIINKILTGAVYAAYPLLLIFLLLGRHARFLKVLLIPAISFVVVSVVRHAVNRPRPYESWDIDPLIKKNKAGDSMPSRHVFSSAVISMMILFIMPLPGIIFWVITVILALVRILGGVHYPSDVLVGLAIGIGAGLTAFLL
jgi:membrane-associated phospholipid phosphatase